MKKIKFISEVYDTSGNIENLEKNISFQKMTNQGALLGSLHSSFQLRGFFDSADLGSPIRDSMPYPLLTYSFMDYFENHDVSNFYLIEFGSGNSTLYFEKKFKKVFSFETNEAWFNKINVQVKNTEYKLIESNVLEKGGYSIESPDENYFVLIDAACNRYKVALNLLKKLKPHYIILDNSEWYPNTVDLITKEGYLHTPFWGYKNTEHWESCTSLFTRLKDIKLLSNNKLMPPPLSRRLTSLWDEP